MAGWMYRLSYMCSYHSATDFSNFARGDPVGEPTRSNSTSCCRSCIQQDAVVDRLEQQQVRWRRAAAYVVCRDDDPRILLTRFYAPDHPDSGRWTMPGGAME